MRKIIIVAAAMVASGCLHVEPAEQRAAVRENAERATAEARGIAGETNAETRAANCANFITISRNLRGRIAGRDDAAMEQAWSRYNAFLVQRLGSQGSATQLVASSANFLLGADPGAREAAARYCIERASTAGAGAGKQNVELAASGLTTGSEGLHHANIIAFGQPRAAVVSQLSAILGRPRETGSNPDCPTGPVETASFGELDLTFEDGRFTGWMIDGANGSMLQSRNGLSVGDQRIDIDADAEVVVDAASTLGTELSVDGIGALLSGPGEYAEVTTLFAGRTCFAR